MSTFELRKYNMDIANFEQGYKRNDGKYELLMNPGHCVKYAVEMMQGRFLEGEPIILMSMFDSIEYVRLVLKKRWLEAERRHSAEPYWLRNYVSALRPDHDMINELQMEYGNWIPRP